MYWWIWGVLGVALLIGEVLTPGVFLLFFGFGALIVAGLVVIGLGGSMAVQWFLFSVTSVALLLVFRKKILAGRNTGSTDVDSLVGEIGIAASTIGANDLGKIELRGTSWTAKNVGPLPISKGQHCKVQRVDGLTLDVVKHD